MSIECAENAVLVLVALGRRMRLNGEAAVWSAGFRRTEERAAERRRVGVGEAKSCDAFDKSSSVRRATSLGRGVGEEAGSGCNGEACDVAMPSNTPATRPTGKA